MSRLYEIFNAENGAVRDKMLRAGMRMKFDDDYDGDVEYNSATVDSVENALVSEYSFTASHLQDKRYRTVH